jgi:hypothetical protein
MAKKKLGDVTTINLTVLKAGVSSDGGKSYAMNVIPTEAIAGFDVRISPHEDLGEFSVGPFTVLVNLYGGRLKGFWCVRECSTRGVRPRVSRGSFRRSPSTRSTSTTRPSAMTRTSGGPFSRALATYVIFFGGSL